MVQFIGSANFSPKRYKYEVCDTVVKSNLAFNIIIGFLNRVFQDTNKQVKDSDFPSITICTEGINMDAVVEAISQDFDHWLRVNKNVTTEDGSYNEEEHNNYVKEFLAEMFSISPDLDISVEDIALAYSSPDPDK